MPPGPNSLLKRRVSRLLREPLAGTTVQIAPGIPGHLRAWFSQFRCMGRPGKLGVFLAVFRLTSEGFVGSSPTAPTFFEYLSVCLGGTSRSRTSRRYLAYMGQELCGTWMPRAETTCARTLGHGGDCMTATNMANRREYNH